MLSCKKFTTEIIDWINVAISKESDKIISLTRWMVAACLKCKKFLNIDGKEPCTVAQEMIDFIDENKDGRAAKDNNQNPEKK